MRYEELLTRMRAIAEPKVVDAVNVLMVKKEQIPINFRQTWNRHRPMLERTGQIRATPDGWIVGQWEQRIIRKPLADSQSPKQQDFLSRYSPEQLESIQLGIAEVQDIHIGYSKDFLETRVLQELAVWSTYDPQVVADSLLAWIKKRGDEPSLREAYLHGILKGEARRMGPQRPQDEQSKVELSDEQKRELEAILSKYYEQHSRLDYLELAEGGMKIEAEYIARTVRQAKGLALSAQGGGRKRKAADQC